MPTRQHALHRNRPDREVDKWRHGLVGLHGAAFRPQQLAYLPLFFFVSQQVLDRLLENSASWSMTTSHQTGPAWSMSQVFPAPARCGDSSGSNTTAERA